MKRIKSQSSCLSQGGIIVQGRARSKRLGKAEVLEFSYNYGSRPKNNNVLLSEQLQSSTLKTASKISTGSLKNLRVGPYLPSTTKTSAQNTSRLGNSGSGISAKILK
jgi:hypothetical protein